MNPKFKLGDLVRKAKGSEWHGTVVGTYSTSLTPEGYAVESATERGSVQIYPAAALEPWAYEPDVDAATMLRLIKTIKYLVGIAERGEGRKIADDETPEQFVLGYVKRLEQTNQDASAERLTEVLQGWWKAHRPVGWTEDQHRSCPHVNLVTNSEKALATALLELLGKGIEQKV